MSSSLQRLAFAIGALAIVGPVVHAAERAIEKEIVVAATPEQVWNAWTTREGITSFFAPDARIEARVGGAFAIYINPMAEPGQKGADDMRFMALQPPRMLSFDWNAPPHLPQVREQRTFVVLDEQVVGMPLVVEHHTLHRFESAPGVTGIRIRGHARKRR